MSDKEKDMKKVINDAMSDMIKIANDKLNEIENEYFSGGEMIKYDTSFLALTSLVQTCAIVKMTEVLDVIKNKLHDIDCSIESK